MDTHSTLTTRVLTTLAATAAIGGLLAVAPVAGATDATDATGAIAGVAFEDLDRDQRPGAGERLLPDHLVYVFDGAGRFVTSAFTNAEGRYRAPGVAPGTYTVAAAASTWGARSADWTPTTTPTWVPEHRVVVEAGADAVADFGWRPIVRSTDPARPLSTWRGPDGPVVEVFNDAVPAAAVGEVVLAGALVGAEAARTTIRLDLSTVSATGASYQESNGVYAGYQAIVSVDWASWLHTGERTLFHEYGHAWAGYWAVEVQQDPSLAGYLAARGLTGDPRVDTGYAWDRDELVAEDYRQLFGTPAAAAVAQANRELPPAAEVAGLREYLAGAFRQPPAATPPPEPVPEPVSEPVAVPVDVTAPVVAPAPVLKSASFSFTVNAAATVSVVVRDHNDKVVRVLARDVAVAAGDASFPWDRRDARGRSVRRGDYVVEVVVTDGRTSDTERTTFRAA